MTDVELYRPTTSIAHWTQEASDAHKLATALVKTSFVPAAYKGKPDEAAACIVKGAEIGLTPLASLAAIVVIQGTPALTAQALRAVVQSQGHEVWIDSATDKKVVARARRKGSDVEHTSTWTIERATKLGLTGKANWKSQPEAMLIARATSEVCRLVAADAILGLAYSEEELRDGGRDEPAATRRVARKSTREGHEGVLEDAVAAVREERAAIEPPADDLVETVAGPHAESLSKLQLGKILGLFNDIGWKDRDDRLRATRLLIGRNVESANDLTKHEASKLIDELEAVAAADDPSLALADALEALNG